MIAQVLNTPKIPLKSLITNKVTLVFVDSLCILIAYTFNCISVSGFGQYRNVNSI